MRKNSVQYNDYIAMTKRYLKNYNMFKVTINNLEGDRQALNEDIETDVAAPIAKYGDMPQGGHTELNQIEASAERHIQMVKDEQALEADLRELQRIIKKIDTALEGLEKDDAEIVRDYYIDGRSWYYIASTRNLSERWARAKANKAVNDMALMLFGLKSRPVQLRFVFAD